MTIRPTVRCLGVGLWAGSARFLPQGHQHSMCTAFTSFALVLLSAPILLAQTPATASTGASAGTRHFDSRAQLMEAAQAAERQQRTGEAWLLRSRLERGDFQEGDRIVVTLEANPRPDTMQVRANKVIQFAGMSELSLHGVLRSELNDTLRAHLSKYLRNPNVTATPLLSVAVLGSVGVPGYHYTAADVLLRDVIMRAGGPRENADLDRVVIRRNGEVIWGTRDTRVALTDGLSLDKLHLRAGDEIVVPAQRQRSWTNMIAVISSGVAVTAAIIGMQVRR